MMTGVGVSSALETLDHSHQLLKYIPGQSIGWTIEDITEQGQQRPSILIGVVVLHVR
jgi:hypothetical protein